MPRCCKSSPPRGTWIEIVVHFCGYTSAKRRPPHGGRGLKCNSILTLALRSLSRPPHGGRGLKLAVLLSVVRFLASSPPRGTWIEIASTSFGWPWSRSRPPHGGRGLKLSPVFDNMYLDTSSPPRGTWIEMLIINDFFRDQKSSPPRGTWIEIQELFVNSLAIRVVPPTGDVD